MDFIAWDNSYKLGIEQIDTEHKELFNIANKLYNAMTEGKGKAVLAEIFAELVSYAARHFSHEEALFMESQYTDKEQHCTEHNRLIQTVGDLMDKFNERSGMLSMETMLFLRDWIVNHILKTDMGLKTFL